MDYQCPACRKHTPDVAKVFKEDRRVRVIYRDTPIFGPRSEQAARVAIASQFQGKHQAMHAALMAADMPLDEQALRTAAKKAGVDWDRLQRDLDARGDEIDAQIAWNMELSMATGIAGTPAFIVEDTLANGALDYNGLKAEIADARAEHTVEEVSQPPEKSVPADLEPETPVSSSEAEDAAAPGPESPADATPIQRTPFDEKAVATEVVTRDEDPSGFAFWPWLIAAAVAALGLFAWAARRRAS